MKNNKYDWERLNKSDVVINFEGENRYRQKVKIWQSLYRFVKYNGYDFLFSVEEIETGFLVKKLS